jgi:hypothetical protein
MPLISHKLKLIFAHVPKTGGASIKTAILKMDPGAEMVNDYHSVISREIIEEYKDYYKFTIARNSWNAMSSRYRFTYTWQNKHKKPPPGHPTFREWLLDINNSHKKYGSPGGVASQHWYYIDDKGLTVDQIIQYDKINEGLEELFNKTGIRIDISKERGHFYGKYNWRSIYEQDPETIEIVRKMCEYDINYFNWKYD